MKDNDTLERIVPVSRRRVLKAGAVTAAGVGLFAGTAAATNPKQINFCGCSQVCVETDSEGRYKVITAWEEDGEWTFNLGYRDATFPANSNFCYDVEDEPGKKIIGVKSQGFRDDDDLFVYCNPNQCAQKALDTLFDEYDFTCVNDENDDDEPDPVFGSNLEDALDKGTVSIVRGRCGEAGRSPPGQKKKNGNDD